MHVLALAEPPRDKVAGPAGSSPPPEPQIGVNGVPPSTKRHTWHDPYVEAANEFGLAIFLFVGHSFVVAVIVVCGRSVEALLEFAYHGHEPQLFGVSLRFMISGGEFALVIVYLLLGTISATRTLLIALIFSIRDQWGRLR